jgi:hypothetical protein
MARDECPQIPDVELLLQSAFAAALVEASEREEQGEAAPADQELLAGITEATDDAVGKQTMLLDRWERGSGRRQD